MSFIDWETYARLNRESQTADLEAQMEKLRASGQSAQHLLSQSKWDAQQAQLRDPNVQMSSVGSYTDYLKAKDNMRQQLTQMMSGTGGDFGLLQQQILQGGMGEEAKRMWTEMQDKESRFGFDVQQSGEGASRMQAEAKARADSQRAAAEERARTDAENARNFYAGVQGKWAQANQFLPFGRPGENRSDQTQLARMLAVGRAGGQWAPQNEEQNRQVNAQAWQGGSGNAYGADFKQVTNPTRDAYGRPIDPKTGRPISGIPMY